MSQHILIVDDDRIITNALSILLKRAGYAITISESGLEALERLSDGPDLVILDIMMPGLNGYEVCREIRVQLPSVPILMLTARGQTEDKVMGLEMGADAYFAKPFDSAELLAQVRAMLRRAKQEQPAGQQPLECGGLQLWENTHVVTLDCVELELTPKEYELLRVFLRRPGVVFGRETLLREVWGYQFTSDTRTVDVHIQRLRAKIEADPAHPRRLCTVRGFGYRLVNDPINDGPRS
jgi:DNA-binding response OmpR family regulator